VDDLASGLTACAGDSLDVLYAIHELDLCTIQRADNRVTQVKHITQR